MHGNKIETLMAVILLFFVSGCGGGSDTGPVATELQVAATPGGDGIFDPAPASDGSSTLWMSHSSVNWSTDDPTLSKVHTRIASSPDSGVTWTDAGVDPNRSASWPDFVVSNASGNFWATWRFEVSRLFYDPYDADPARRWKMLWHRVLAAGYPVSKNLFLNSWIGYSSAPAPNGNWSAERKLFTGSIYNDTDMDVFIGPPEFPLDVDYSANLGGCSLFTEPGVLARSDGIYISLQCTSDRKIVLVRCDRDFASCDYLGDLLTAGEAAQFSLSGESLDFFGASELVETATATYLIVTGIEDISADENRYSGCLVFRVADLSSATLERNGGEPVLVKQVHGSSGSFNGACGYHAQAGGSGIIYSEYVPNDTPRFHMFSSHIVLP